MAQRALFFYSTFPRSYCRENRQLCTRTCGLFDCPLFDCDAQPHLNVAYPRRWIGRGKLDVRSPSSLHLNTWTSSSGVTWNR
ncbi:hypothetical protein TNCV_4500521 [Trichonephila clavipes]|nr:hypothetical protein TNCV_4500521 [Trichonephila clavipes]